MRLENYGPGSVNYENTLVQVGGDFQDSVPYFLNLENTGWVGAYWDAPATYYNAFRSVSDVGLGGWNHAAWTRNVNSNTVRFYFNGDLLGTDSYNAATQAPFTQTAALRLSIGGNRYFSTFAVRGFVDEVRIADRAHGNAWIKFQHEMVANDSVVVLGAVETLSLP